MAKNVTIKNVTFNYVKVFELDPIDGKYSAQIVFSKDNPALPELLRAAQEAMQTGVDRFGKAFANDPTVKKVLAGDVTVLLHDGDVEKEGDAEYEGCYYKSVSSKSQPQVVKRNTTGIGGSLIQITDEEEFRSTDKGWVNVSVFPFATNGNKGIGIGLNHILKEETGARTFSKPTAESIFGAEIAKEDDDDLPM